MELLSQFLRDASTRGRSGGGGSKYEGSHTTSEYDSSSEFGGSEGRGKKINGYRFVSMDPNGTPITGGNMPSIPSEIGVPTFGIREESRRDRTGRRLADDAKKATVKKRKQPGGSRTSSSSSSSSWGKRKVDPTANLTPAALSLLNRTAGGKSTLIGGLPNPNATPRDGGSLGGSLRGSYTPRGGRQRGDYSVTPRDRRKCGR